ncbi:GDP-L-fucose synthase [Inhella inkyongensis]|uniref:GDP-L-fucose synthase n=1 Tax=Inhella inkyongensis TaxID=392593 RepID=A0A840S9T6_9BURK|nr:NAD-dependent epimerase/dehydratase family protein [Inhella inkyongensis]MBB5206392.1 GDP-L-fucose synthase [Inhella inkyongensis]
MILVTGATGFLGRHVCALLEQKGLAFGQTSLSLGVDLRDPAATQALFARVFEGQAQRRVIHCAAFVGGIQFGLKHAAELFHHNLAMTLSLLEASKLAGVQRLVNPISNCAYPGAATLFKEDEFWDGPLHESVLVYGFARKASWVGAYAYQQQHGLDSINLILSNMYGPGDHFEPERSHALGALVHRIHEAKRKGAPEVVIWGTGTPVREWLHVQDGAEALVRALDAPPCSDPINIGVASGISILEMARLIADELGYTGRLLTDPSKPDGAPYKTVDGSRGQALLNWCPKREFRQGVRDTIDWYLKNHHA